MDDMEMSGVAAAAPKPPEDPAPAREKERWRRVLVVAGLVALPLLAFFVLGRESASTVLEIASAKLTAMNNGAGFMNASHGHDAAGNGDANVDELLGGLLAPGMDRPSCRSRYQMSRYFKHFPYEPSPHLRRKVRAYEARHRRCAPGTPLYAKSVEQLKSGSSSAAGDAMECSYVVWLPLDGLGNRMLSMVSTFLYALLTGRVLLVALPPDSGDLFCEPFPGATWLLPPDFPVAADPHPDQSYWKLLEQNKIAVAVDTANATAPPPPPVPPYVYLSLGPPQLEDGLFFCGEHQLELGKVSWLLLRSDLYFAPSLYAVAELRGELRQLFPAKESVHHLLARYLLHPTNPVWGLVTRFYAAYLAPASRRIGIQIRMFGFASIPADDMYNQILRCSRQEHILPGTDADDEAPPPTAGPAAGYNGSTAIMIASLYGDYYERLRSRYYEHAANGGGGGGAAVVGVFQPTHEERQATENLAHNQRALAEIYLLSFSDELVTSGLSTFGYVSSGLAGVRPAILRTAFDHKVPEKPCWRAASMEPCNLTPPRGVVCRGEAAGDKDEEMARHVRVCEDTRDGVKFFD